MGLNIGNYNVIYSKIISFSFDASVAENILDSGSPWTQMEGARPKNFTIEVIAQSEDDMLNLAQAIREAQLSKAALQVTGLPLAAWDGYYYITISGKYSAEPLSLTLNLVEAT